MAMNRFYGTALVGKNKQIKRQVDLQKKSVHQYFGPQIKKKLDHQKKRAYYL